MLTELREQIIANERAGQEDNYAVIQPPAIGSRPVRIEQHLID